MSAQPKKSPLLDVSVALNGPITHDMKAVEAAVQNSIASFAVANRLPLEDVAANYTGLRRKCGELYACYTLRQVKGERRKAKA